MSDRRNFSAAARWLSSRIERAMDRADEGNWVVTLSLATMLIVGLGDYVTGVEPTFTLLYLFPLAFGTWLRGRTFGVVLALLATACSTVAVVLASHGSFRLVPLVWNEFASCVTMLLVVWILTVLNAYVARERSRRELAVEQLRHAERLNIIGKLAAGVAHELGTPLNVISASAELLEAGELNRSNVSKHSSTIIEQTRKMTTIIRHLLDFGRRGGASRKVVDLNEVVVRAVDLLLPMAKKRSCVLLVQPGEHPVPVTGNPSEIEQVFSNLIVNALQAMEAGGTVSVRVSVEPRATAGATFRPFAQVAVQDDGAGIDEQVLAHVFDPFFTTKGVGEGTGLGLSVSYGIVHDHEGCIEVTSEKGKGARFSVLLPLATSRSPRSA